MPSSVFWGMQHINSNVLCGLKLELTGNDPNIHELIEVAVVPLDQMLELHSTFALFNMRVRPQITNPSDDFKHCRLTKSEIADACLRAYDSFKVADILHEWFLDMKLPRGKKIIPLTYNFPAQRQILINWLDYDLYSEIFSEDHRDLLAAAHFINDRECVRGEPAVFSKQDMSWLAKKCNVPQVQSGTAVSDAFLMAQTYKRMLQL